MTGATAAYSYNADSLVSGICYGSGKDSQSFGYDSRHRLTSDALKTSSGTAVASVSYGYNADSEVTSETTAGLAGAASSTYTYDEAGRLTSWNNGSTTTGYGYDSNGNLTQSGSKAYTYDARDELTGDGTGSYAYTARGTSSAEPGPGGPLAVTSDAYGDQATAGTRAYAYDALGLLAGDTAPGGELRVQLRRRGRHPGLRRHLDLHLGPGGQRAGRGGDGRRRDFRCPGADRLARQPGRRVHRGRHQYLGVEGVRPVGERDRDDRDAGGAAGLPVGLVGRGGGQGPDGGPLV